MGTVPRGPGGTDRWWAWWARGQQTEVSWQCVVLGTHRPQHPKLGKNKRVGGWGSVCPHMLHLVFLDIVSDQQSLCPLCSWFLKKHAWWGSSVGWGVSQCTRVRVPSLVGAYAGSTSECMKWGESMFLSLSSQSINFFKACIPEFTLPSGGSPPQSHHPMRPSSHSPGNAALDRPTSKDKAWWALSIWHVKLWLGFWDRCWDLINEACGLSLYVVWNGITRHTFV